MVYTTFKKAVEFLSQKRPIVVKPWAQWGARGVSTHISNEKELHYALGRAGRFEKGIVLEECVNGIDRRLIFVDQCFTAAIQRTPPFVTGNGIDTIRGLIISRNKEKREIDPANIIPLDRETLRCITGQKLDFDSVLSEIKFKKNSIKEILSHIAPLKKKFREIRKSTGKNVENRWIMGELKNLALGNIDLQELDAAVKGGQNE